jgi:hypothetical protein
MISFHPENNQSTLSQTTEHHEGLLHTVNTAAKDQTLELKSFILRDFFADLSAWDHVNIMLIWTLGLHAAVAATCHDYLFSRSAFYQRLHCSNAVSDVIADLKASTRWARSKRIVGVHIRAFHLSFDWAVVTPFLPSTPPSSTSSACNLIENPTVIDGEVVTSTGVSETTISPQMTNALRFDEASPVHAFIATMREILHRHPSTRFFVASNSVAAKDEMVRQFGADVIITTPAITASAATAVGDRSSIEGMILAAADFFLLSSTSFIIHSTGSSFAKEAALVRSIPLIDVSIRCS